MNAIEAKRMSDVAIAAKKLALYIGRIKSAAKNGEIAIWAGKLSPKEVDQFRLLGYEVIEAGPNHQVCWHHPRTPKVSHG